MSEFSYADLVTWAKAQLPEWQQDALRRLVGASKLSPEDVMEVAALALAVHVENGDDVRAVPPPDEVPVADFVHPSVQLSAIRDIEFVNALAAGPIPFGVGGLTVVYGGNGTGKSGVARILKKACHARDPGGPVLFRG